METYLSPNSIIKAWMNPESDIRIFLTRIEKTVCRGHVVCRKEQIALSGEKLSFLEKLFPVIDQLVYLKRYKYIPNFSQQTRSLSSQATLSTQTSSQNSNRSQQQ